MATKQIMHNIQDDICCMWVYTILLEKCHVHMPCSPNDQNDLILQLLQIPLVCYSTLHKDWSHMCLFADSTWYILQYGVKTTMLCVNFQRQYTRSHMLYTTLHSAGCLLGCKMLTFPHPLVTPFTFPTSHSIMVHISNCCMFF